MALTAKRHCAAVFVLVVLFGARGSSVLAQNDPGCWLATTAPCKGETGSCRCPFPGGSACPITYTKYLVDDLRLVDTGHNNENDICYEYHDDQIDCWQTIACPAAGSLNCIFWSIIYPHGSCPFGQGEVVSYTHRIQGYWRPNGSCTAPPSPCFSSEP